MALKWLIVKNNILVKNQLFKRKFSNLTHSFFFDSDVEQSNYFWDDLTQEGVFIDGYILPRLSFNKKANPKTIFEQYKNSGQASFLNYKGIYTIVIIEKEKTVISTDIFGVSKFFYSQSIVSNNLWVFNEFSEIKVSLEAVYMYLIFNYFIEEYTQFENIFKSVGGEFYTMQEQIIVNKYFDIYNYLSEREVLYDEKQTFNHAPELWLKIISQYLEYFKGRTISQTLTAGLDSRMILAAFRKLDYAPKTFTFGDSQSMDVVYASKLAQMLDITHYHFYPGNPFFQNFGDFAETVISEGCSLSSIYRGHRLDAYQKLQKISEVVFFGFIGSEIIRGGVFPDGLIYPNFILDIWLNKEVSIKKILTDNFVNVDQRLAKTVEDKIMDEYKFYRNPDSHIFKVIIPLHFGQDISLLHKMDIASVAPYWDIDFLDFQKTTPFFLRNEDKDKLSKLGHFKRRKGPKYSCKMINLMDPSNAKVSLGKGYSPKEYDSSILYASIKFLIHKYTKNVTDKSNFSYDEWYKAYLLNIFESNSFNSDIFINPKKNLLSLNYQDELSLLPYTKIANLSLAFQKMSNSNNS